MKHVFIITYGRSGSTLLAGLLNAYPGVVVRGENNNALFRSWKVAIELAQAASEHGMKDQDSPARPWYGIDHVDIEAYEKAIANVFTDHVLRPPPGTQILGFKEIRYDLDAMNDHELEGYLSFLVRRFDDSLLVFNSRDLSATANSAWFRGVPSARRFLELSEARLRDAFSRRRDHSVWVHYDEYVDDPRALEPILDRLGLPFEEERIIATLGKRYSYTPGAKQNRRTIIQWEAAYSKAVADRVWRQKAESGREYSKRILRWIGGVSDKLR